ncbi:MAG TPA: DNA cytosine methyltransferase [Solirubrobacteraceae bacterium]|jgi:DNA (cytosine-5)-methyltransferase 1|nr:DNA cytosine methyltransferase [Solirubrobacteraceae bacterium]
MSTEPSFVDLFGGAGGLTRGLGAAGWRHLLSIENWMDAVATHRLNFPNHSVVSDDIRDVTSARLAAELDGRPDWIVGGPPCQGFSTVGKRKRDDERNFLMFEFRRIVALLKPDGFLIENVLGLKDMQWQNQIIEMFKDLDYSAVVRVLRAADYGVPQLRRRVIFAGHRDRGYFLGPRPTHSEHDWITVWDAIGDLPSLMPGETATGYSREPFTGFQRLAREGSDTIQGHSISRHPDYLVEAISHIPDGGNRRSIPDHLQPSSGFHNTYSRLFSKAPAVAITQNMGKPSGTRCIHPFQHRGLSAREGARLQSFPDRFHFTAGQTSQRLQIANAVPPMLGEAIGRGLEDPERWAMTEADRAAIEDAQLAMI